MSSSQSTAPFLFPQGENVIIKMIIIIIIVSFTLWENHFGVKITCEIHADTLMIQHLEFKPARSGKR